MFGLHNDRLIRALLRKPVDRTPIWFMRQAGRYLPEFRALRAKCPNFMDFCKQPTLACEATLQPIARFPLDAAIVFSDILTIPAAMGLDLDIVPERGPVIQNPIRTAADIARLHPVDVTALNYVFEAIGLVAHELQGKIPLIGFAGSPWTLACYTIEGQTSKIFSWPKRLLYQAPALLTALLSLLTDWTIAYLNAQIAAGARVLMLFDTWGGILTTAAYQQFSLFYMAKIAKGLHRSINGETIPLIFFTKGGGLWLSAIAKSGCDAISLDWTVDIAQARALVGDQIALQGNLDPAILHTTPKAVSTAVEAILAAYGPGFGHVFNLGHGIEPHTPIENVSAMIAAVHRFGVK